MTWLRRLALAAILVVAAAARYTGLDWDGYQHHHPDERYISWVASTIELPSLRGTDWQAAFNPRTSTFNPFRWPQEASSEGIVVPRDQQRDFAYGHAPLYLGVAATRLIEAIGPAALSVLPDGWVYADDLLNRPGRIEFDHLTIVGRALAATAELTTVLVVYLLGRRLYSEGAGLLAAAFMAVAVMHIQLAHFFISDPFLVAFVVVALYLMVLALGDRQSDARRMQKAALLASAVVAGLAVGSKFSAVLLLLPLLAAVWLMFRERRDRIIFALLAVAVAFLTFAVTNPFALLDWTCQLTVGPLDIGSCYAANVAKQNAMVSGNLDLGFTRQYDGTLPYVYFAEMQLRWGLGWLLGLTGFVGLGWAIIRQAQSLRATRSGTAETAALPSMGELLILLWVVPYLLLTGSFYVKFMRYMAPATPFLLLFGAALILSLRSMWGRRVAVAATLGLTAVYALAFVSIYGREHPWNAASRWIHTHVAPGTLILSEQWDDFLPVTMPIDGEIYRRNTYPNEELTWMTGADEHDSAGKLDANLALMAEAEYLTILSNRIYGVVPSQPDRYPVSSQFHQLLFDGRLGYEPVWVGGRYPELFGVRLQPELLAGLEAPDLVTEWLMLRPSLSGGRVDESFVVYDQPMTMIFRNSGELSASDMREQFDLSVEH